MFSYRKIVRWTIAFAVLIGTFCLVLVLNNTANHQDRITTAIDNFTYFTDFSMTDLDGETFTQEDLKGYKVTVFNGWAPWCGPCTNEMPDLEALNREYQDKGLQIIGVAADYYQTTTEGYIDQITDVVESTGVTYPILLSDQAFYEAPYFTMNSAFPCTWAVDEEGNLIELVSGAKSEDAWREYFDKWLEGR